MLSLLLFILTPFGFFSMFLCLQLLALTGIVFWELTKYILHELCTHSKYESFLDYVEKKRYSTSSSNITLGNVAYLKRLGSVYFINIILLTFLMAYIASDIQDAQPHIAGFLLFTLVFFKVLAIQSIQVFIAAFIALYQKFDGDKYVESFKQKKLAVWDRKIEGFVEKNK